MALSLQWLGHSTWLIESDGARVLIDPFLSSNPQAACPPEAIEASTILVSHGHFDHVQDVASIARRCGAVVVANFEIASWFAEHHQVSHTQPMNLGGSLSLPFGAVKMTPALHSSQLPDGRYGGNPGGFLCQFADARIYYTGDTALFSDMALFAEPSVDILILPIGDLFTMGIEDSIKAIQWIRPRYVFPSHYNTWPPIAQDPVGWANAVKSRTTSIPVVLKPGETFSWKPSLAAPDVASRSH